MRNNPTRTLLSALTCFALVLTACSEAKEGQPPSAESLSRYSYIQDGYVTTFYIISAKNLDPFQLTTDPYPEVKDDSECHFFRSIDKDRGGYAFGVRCVESIVP